MTAPDDSQALARAIRAQAVRMVHHARASHIGSCLSCADLLAVLYAGVLRVDPQRPDWPERDRLLLSKGHAAAILYAVLAERGFFPRAWLDAYGDDGVLLTGHASHHVPGVELSAGSLGHALSIGCGLALAARAAGRANRVYVLLGDGEQDEGSVWEAALFAAHHNLTAVTALVDINGQQGFGRTGDIVSLTPLREKWAAFGWQTHEIDGHDHAAIAAALAEPAARPRVMLARTVKGKGVSFMEDQPAWHYRSPDAAQLAQALREIGEA